MATRSLAIYEQTDALHPARTAYDAFAEVVGGADVNPGDRVQRVTFQMPQKPPEQLSAYGYWESELEEWGNQVWRQITRQGDIKNDVGYLQMRLIGRSIEPGRSGIMDLFWAKEDPLPTKIDMSAPAVRPSEVDADWNRIPVGVGVHPTGFLPEGGTDFTVHWDLKRSGNIAIHGNCGSGVSSAVRSVILGAYNRGFDIHLIDIDEQSLNNYEQRAHKHDQRAHHDLP